MYKLKQFRSKYMMLEVSTRSTQNKSFHLQPQTDHCNFFKILKHLILSIAKNCKEDSTLEQPRHDVPLARFMLLSILYQSTRVCPRQSNASNEVRSACELSSRGRCSSWRAPSLRRSAHQASSPGLQSSWDPPSAVPAIFNRRNRT